MNAKTGKYAEIRWPRLKVIIHVESIETHRERDREKELIGGAERERGTVGRKRENIAFERYTFRKRQ